MGCVEFCGLPAVGDRANVLSCSEFAEVCGVGVVLAGLAPTGSIPAASTIFKERNSLLSKGVALSCSEQGVGLPTEPPPLTP